MIILIKSSKQKNALSLLILQQNALKIIIMYLILSAMKILVLNLQRVVIQMKKFVYVMNQKENGTKKLMKIMVIFI